MKKSIFCIALALLMLLSGCSKKPEKTNETATAEATLTETDPFADDEFSTSDSSQLKLDELTDFSKATGYDPKKMVPQALLATQVVAGVNYLYLCKNDADKWSLVTVYRDLKGNYSITSDEELDVSKIYNNEYSSDEIAELDKKELLAGGWVANPELTKISVSKKIDAVMKSDPSLIPIVLINKTDINALLLCVKGHTLLYALCAPNDTNISRYYKFEF